MHCEVVGGVGVDHRDHNGLNNQRKNLRKATQSQNNGNLRKTPGRSSQFKGVSFRRDRGCWKSQIRFHGQLHFLGLFDCEKLAARAYDCAARQFFGEFALLNFP